MVLAQLTWFVLHHVYPQFVPIDHIAWIFVPYGVCVAGLIGVLSGVVPALRSARLSVIDGLRKAG
jgi:ABC-type lipoprotein release transport system permease subunit